MKETTKFIILRITLSLLLFALIFVFFYGTSAIVNKTVSKKVDELQTELVAINEKLDKLEENKLTLPTPTPEVIEVPVIQTVEVEKPLIINAHHYEDDNFIAALDLEYDLFFIYQYDARNLIMNTDGRYVEFEIVRSGVIEDFGDGPDYTRIKITDEYFIKAFMLSSDMALVIYVPLDGTWYSRDPESIADEIYTYTTISLG